MNKCHFLGNLTRDPELKQLNNNKSLVNFSIAINRVYGKGAERKKETAYLDCEAWDTGAEAIAKYFTKGKPIIVHGAIKQEEWEDKNGGGKRTKLKLRVEDFEFVPSNNKPEEGEEQEQEQVEEAPKKTPRSRTTNSNSNVNQVKDADDDIPF